MVTQYKVWNNKEYHLSGSIWIHCSLLAHDVWNYYNPNNRIKRGDGNVIHHKDEDSSNNKIKNLEKMTRSKHNSLHATGKVAWNKGKSYSKEIKDKISKSRLGKESGFKGHKVSEQSILKRNFSRKFNYLIKKLDKLELKIGGD